MYLTECTSKLFYKKKMHERKSSIH